MPAGSKAYARRILEGVLKASKELAKADLSTKERINYLVEIRQATVDVNLLETSETLDEKELSVLYVVKTLVDDIWTNLGTDFSVPMESIMDKIGEVSYHLGGFVTSALNTHSSLVNGGSGKMKLSELFKAISLYFATLESVEKTGQLAYGERENEQ